MTMEVNEGIVVAMIDPICAHGGMDYYDYSLLQALVATGVSPRFYTSESGPLAPSSFPISEYFRGVFSNAPKAYRAAKWVIALLRSLADAKRHGAEIVHFQFFNTGFLERLGVLAAKAKRLKVIATIHDVEPFHYRRTEAAARALLSSLNGIIVHNHVSLTEVERYLAREKHVAISVIPHGNYVGFVGSRMLKTAARKRIGIPLGHPIFLFFGQIRKVKGLDIVIRAMAEVKRNIPDARLVIAGRLWKEGRTGYDRLILEFGLADNIIWHDGYISQDLVDSYFYASDAVVLPYRKIYQSGVLLMAMSYGIPVIASDLPGMREVIDHEKNGLLFPDGDASQLAGEMERTVRDSLLAEALGRKGREHVEAHHGWAAIGGMTKALYRRVLGENHDRKR